MTPAESVHCREVNVHLGAIVGTEVGTEVGSEVGLAEHSEGSTNTPFRHFVPGATLITFDQTPSPQIA